MLTISSAALAETNDTQTGTSLAKENEAIADIIVTAQRRVERLQDTPVAITAVSGQQLAARNIRQVEDLAQIAPSLNIANGSGNTASSSQPIIYIRGIGQNDTTISSDPGVGVYVNGVYVSRTAGAVLDLPDIERVEVLRGPQGTLFGKNTTGGAISLTTTVPGQDVSMAGDVTYGKYNLREARFVGLAPITSTLGVKLAGLYREEDGYGTIRDIATGRKRGELGGLDRIALGGGLYWTPSEQVSVTLSGDYSRNRDDPIPRDFNIMPGATAGLIAVYNGLVGFPGGTPLLASALPANRDDSFGTSASYNDQEVYGVSGDVSLRFGDMTVRSITAYRDQALDNAYDIDTLPAQFGAQEYSLRQKQFSQELQLLGTLLDERVNFILGGFYLHEKAKERTGVLVLGGVYQALEALPGPFIPFFPGVTCPAPFPAPCLGGAGNPFNLQLDAGRTADVRQITDSYALFGQVTAKITDTLSLTGGLRYTDDRKDFQLSAIRRISGAVTVPLTKRRQSFSKLTPKIGIEWKPNTDTLVYASMTRGFKSGGFNGSATSPAELASFTPETVTSYEIGGKMTLLDRKLRLNAAAFQTDYDDIQLSRTTTDPNTGVFVVAIANAGKARIRGVELELDSRPVKALTLSASIGYLHSEYRSLLPGTQATLTDRLPRTPKWNINLGGEYAIPLGFASLTPRVDYVYRSKSYNDEANSETVASQSAGLWNGRLTLTTVDQKFSIAAFGRNLFNKRYVVFGVDQSAIGVVITQYNRPREYGLTLSARF